MDQDVRPYLMALTAMNVRVLTELAAIAPTPEKARARMFYFESKIIEDIGKIRMTLRPDEGPHDLAGLHEKARALVAELLSAQKFV